MSKTDALLEAGGLIPVKTKIDKAATVDNISARLYRHAALGDRPIVRLTADGLAQGDDLAMEFLGFEPPQVEGPVALRRRQALGFPGWALINDPDHARYALELVKEFRKEARRAKSKPGHAYDAFVDIAKRLDRSVAHFLPSYWEEVGREFMQAGNSTYAARAFGKAREAEKVHSLQVDESLRQDAFLEFALAGCLSNKALTEYCKDLQQNHEPGEAWQFFRELCVRRTLGGMPPWGTLTKELGQLIKAAGLDVDDEIQQFLKKIIAAPAMSRAPAGFWKAVKKPLTALAAKDDHVAGELLNLMPESTTWRRDNVWVWIEYLKELNVIENAWQDDVPDAAGPRDGAAAWLMRIVHLHDNPPQCVHDLLASMGDRLRTDGVPLNLIAWRFGRIQVDLLDLALELGIPVEDPTEKTAFALTVWATPGETAVDRPRDPVHVYSDERFRKLLEDAVPQAAGDADFEAAAHGKSALAEARKAWLLRELEQIDSSALPMATDTLSGLAAKTSRATFQEFPEAFDALKNVSLTAAIQRTLRGGLLDEYGWPALEEIVEKLNPDGQQTLKLFGAAPNVIVSDGLNAIVVGPTGVLLEHEIQVTKGFALEDLQFLDDQLLVVIKSDRWDGRTYWSGNPKKQTDVRYYYARDVLSRSSVPLDSGGSFVGGGTIHAGDEETPERTDFIHDGEHFWRYCWYNEERAMRQVSPKGELGRRSMPAFFEDYLQAGMQLVEAQCTLRHVGDYSKASPLGAKDGRIGWRVRQQVTADTDGDPVPVPGTQECEGIDGRKWKGELGGTGLIPIGLLDQPATDQRLPVSDAHNRRSAANTLLWDPDGQHEIGRLSAGLDGYNAGQAAGLPPIYWHAFTTRDAKASKKLRGLSEKQTHTLLAAAQKDCADVQGQQLGVPELPHTDAAVRRWLKGLKSDRLARGVAGVLCQAARLIAQLEELVTSRDPSVEEVESDSQVEAHVIPGLRALDQRVYRSETPLFPHLHEVHQFFAGDRKAGPIPAGPCNWTGLLDRIELKLFEKYWSETELDESPLIVLEAWSDIGLPDLPGRFRRYRGSFGQSPPVPLATKKDYRDPEPPWHLYEYEGNRYIIWRENYYGFGHNAEVLEYAPAGEFRMLPDLTSDEQTELTRLWSGDRTRDYIAAFRERERPWLEESVLQSAAERLGVEPGEIALLWFGLPCINSYEKNFLPKYLREHLGLKVKEAEAVRQTLKGLKPEILTRLVSAVLDGPPADLWDDGGQRALDRLVTAWGGSTPKRLDVPPEILKVLGDVVGNNGPSMIAALADPTKHPCLKSVSKFRIDVSAEELEKLEEASGDEEVFDSTMLELVSLAVPLFYSGLPAGCEAARLAVTAREKAIKCLQNKSLQFRLGQRYYFGENGNDEAREGLKNLVGKVRRKGSASIADDGILVGQATNRLRLAFRPAKVQSKTDFEHVYNAVRAIADDDGAYMTVDSLKATGRIQGEGYDQICDRIMNSGLAAGQYESNPLHSAPELVEQVAKKLKVSEDTAVLYLQLLTLHDPTTSNLKKWNGWTPARIRKAAGELLDQELILEAKRSRAGRSYFIPGGWEALKIPHLPIESWKLPLYKLRRNALTGKLQFPLPRVLPLRPIPDLFAHAWQRTLDGEAPKYEEVE